MANRTSPLDIGRTLRHLAALLVVVGMIVALSAPVASACAKEEGQHCYAIVEYKMNESKGEAVLGSFANMELYYGRTPWWYKGDRQNGEMWVDMNNSHTRWIEGGAYVGAHYNPAGSSSETTPYYFLANTYGPGTYSELDYAGTGPAYNTWYGLYLAEKVGEANGTWCAQWAWDSKPDLCWSAYRNHATELQTGLEYATSAGTGAEINGRSVGWEQWTDWSWHEGWEGAYAHAITKYDGSPLCMVAPAPGYKYGSVAFADPGC
jgi:hypothetical protein